MKSLRQQDNSLGKHLPMAGTIQWLVWY